jgi:hypothetical protein
MKKIKRSTITTSHPYPPIQRTGRVLHHDRPYVDYGHLDRITIAQIFEFKFKLLPSAHLFQRRYLQSHKALSMIVRTDISKHDMVRLLRQEFGTRNIQYICVGETSHKLNDQKQERQLEIQILLKSKITKRHYLFEEFSESSVIFNVTRNDRAWNEYIKQGLHFIEFGTFKSTSKLGLKNWPRSCNQSSISYEVTSTSSSSQIQNNLIVDDTESEIEVIDEEYERREEIVKQLLKLSETSPSIAMDFLQISIRTLREDNLLWYVK